MTMQDPEKYICTECGSHQMFAVPENAWMIWMGGIMIACMVIGLPFSVLWVPGLILVIMAYRQRKPTCSACKGRRMIPANTPRGQELLLKSPNDSIKDKG